MKKVLVLGAGLVAYPHVRYLLDHGFRVTVASRTVSKAEKIINGHSNGIAKQFDITKESDERLNELVSDNDIVVSLLPYTYHVKVAKSCIKNKKHMVTTSYVSDEMRKLDSAAKESGVILLNEIGVDPGIDHMSAQKIIDEAHEKGGKILSFRSLCGGLPAPDANDNPFGYKLSWSPRGVLLAGRNDAQYLEDGKIIKIPGKDLFDHYFNYHVNGLGDFEAYPNRNSLPYIDTYGIQETKTMMRGTLRNQGWCSTLKKIADLGLLNIEESTIDPNTTFAQYLRSLAKIPDDKNLREGIADFLNLSVESDILDRLEWVGLFSDTVIPFEKSSPLDLMVYLFEQKLQYKPHERDMLVLVHEFIIEYPENKKEKITATMIDYGHQDKDGPSSMSRTVGLPAAIAVRMILEEKITDTGVKIPIKKSIYEPILEELELMEIKFDEKIETL